MTPTPHGLLKWDIAEVARALKLKEGDVRLYFTDGRRVSFLLERRICAEVVHGTLAPSEGAGYDLIDSSGRHWEVRSITKSGIYFCPSYMVGSGRSFEEGGFLAKLRDVEGYIVSDVESFPDVPYWIVPKTSVESWWRGGSLGSATKVTRDSMFRLLRTLPPNHALQRTAAPLSA